MTAFCSDVLGEFAGQQDIHRAMLLSGGFIDLHGASGIGAMPIESTKTTSMEDVSAGVLEKNKEYIGSKDKAKTWYDVSRHI